MSKYVHISQFDPRVHEGGVAQFAVHLKTAEPELVFASHFTDESDLRRPWEFVKAKNYRLIEDGVVDRETTVIADGYYGLGLSGKVDRLIVVCHSTYLGWMRDEMLNPPAGSNSTNPWLMQAAAAQEIAYRKADQLVAVSESAQQELWDFYGLDSTLIRNGIDPDLYHPCEPPGDIEPGSIVEVAGRDINKGADMVAQVIRKGGKGIRPLGFERHKADRWRPWEVAFLPSRHEGGPYAQLEAMATNKKIVAYKSGYLKFEVPDEYFWGTNDYYWGTFNRLIDEALELECRNPREWVLENATLGLFQDKWRESWR